MQDSILNAFLVIGGAVAGSFLGILGYSIYERHQLIDKIRCLVTVEVSQISKTIASIVIDTSHEKNQAPTAETFKKFLARNIVSIGRITDGTAVNLYGKYFHLPTEEMFKLELLYYDLGKFNEKMRLWGKEFSKHEISDVLSGKDLLFAELIDECKKLNESVRRLSKLSWYKKWEKRLSTDPKFRDNS